MHVVKDFGASEACHLKDSWNAEMYGAIFTAYSDDHAALDAVLRGDKFKTDANALRLKDRDTYYACVRCVIEDGATLWSRIKPILLRYKEQRDLKKRRLFTDAKIKEWRRACESIRNGSLSDPLDVEIFKQVGVHKLYGVPVWERKRGSNRCERIFKLFREATAGMNHRAEIAHHTLLAVSTTHNVFVRILVPSRARRPRVLTARGAQTAWDGRGSRGHGDISLSYAVDEAFQRLGWTSAYGPRFVNGRNFAMASVRQGISPLVEAHCVRYHIPRGPPELPRDAYGREHRSYRHALLQGTTGPVLPVLRDEREFAWNVLAARKGVPPMPTSVQLLC